LVNLANANIKVNAGQLIYSTLYWQRYYLSFLFSYLAY